MEKAIEFLNPDTLFKSAAFTQVVITKGPGNTIYIGGQNAINVNREIVGAGDLRQQVEQVMSNIGAALAAGNATFKDVVSLNIYLVSGQDAGLAFQAASRYINLDNPPAVTVVFITALGNPAFLVEINAIAFVAL